MANTIKMFQNDTAPARVFVLKENGTVINLTGATVKFKIFDNTTNTVTNAANQTCALTSATAGKVTYTFVTGDLPSAGTYACEVEVTYSGGKIQTFGPITIVALDEVN